MFYLSGFTFSYINAKEYSVLVARSGGEARSEAGQLHARHHAGTEALTFLEHHRCNNSYLGIKHNVRHLLSDDRIVEPSIKSVVHEETSQYQKIQILDTVEFGR